MGRVPDQVIQDILRSQEAKEVEAKKIGLTTKEDVAEYVSSQFKRKESDMPGWEIFMRRASNWLAPLPKSTISEMQQGSAEAAAGVFRPGVPSEDIRREERIRQRQAQEEGGAVGVAGDIAGIAGGFVGGAESAIARGFESAAARGVAKAPGFIQKAEKVLAPSAGRLVAGVGGGLISEAKEGNIKSLDDIKEDIKSYGAAGLLFETLILGGKAIRAAGRAGVGALSPSLKRIEETVGLKEVKAQRPKQLGLKQETAEQMSKEREPLTEAVQEYMEITGGIRQKVYSDLHEVGVSAQQELKKIKQQINKRYEETGGRVFKKLGNTPVQSTDLYTRMIDLFNENGLLQRMSDGSYKLVDKEAKKFFPTSWDNVKNLFEDLGGLGPINGDQKVKNLSLYQLKGRKIELENLAEFEKAGKNYEAGAVEQLYGSIDEKMTSACPTLKAANEQYKNDILRYKNAYNTIKSSDINKVGSKLLNLENPKNLAAVEAIESLKDLGPEFARLSDRIAEKTIPTKLINNIVKNTDQEGITRAFLNMDQDGFKAVLDASRKFPELLPVARKAKAAAEARRLWLDVKDQAQELGVLSGMSRGAVPRLKIPDKSIVKMAMLLDSTPEQVKFLLKVFPGIPIAVLKSPKPRAAFKVWARTREGEDIIRDAIESPQWIQEDVGTPRPMTEQQAYEERIPGVPTTKPRF